MHALAAVPASSLEARAAVRPFHEFNDSGITHAI